MSYLIDLSAAGILGATFVPCQAWTTTFYDTTIVGRANALVAGWGNAGGGFTFIIMVALYDRLRDDGLSPHKAWRAAFAIVPLPILFTVALATLIFGTDHPNGKWSDRHKPMKNGMAAAVVHHGPSQGEGDDPSVNEKKDDAEKKGSSVDVDVHNVNAEEVDDHDGHYGKPHAPHDSPND